MYVKVVQFTSTSKMQKEMLGAYLQTVWFPELIELGAYHVVTFRSTTPSR